MKCLKHNRKLTEAAGVFVCLACIAEDRLKKPVKLGTVPVSASDEARLKKWSGK